MAQHYPTTNRFGVFTHHNATATCLRKLCLYLRRSGWRKREDQTGRHQDCDPGGVDV
jgi:hypothetical protein